MSKTGEQITAVLLAIVGVAVVALVLSKQSQTTAVLQSGATGFSRALSTALSPITGTNGTLNQFGMGGI